MIPEAFAGNPLLEAAFGVGIFLAGLALAWVVGSIVLPLVRSRIVLRTRSNLDDRLLEAARQPLMVFIIVQGIFLGLTSSTFLSARGNMDRAWVSVIILIVFWTIQRLLGAVLDWYARDISRPGAAAWGSQALPIIRRIVSFTLLALGTLMALASLGISISPLLAGLGIGGLAVALALQPTLSNFVSGTYVLSDGSIRPGDFIELAGGPMGQVTEVGWRTTKLVTPQNNLVMIPNAKLADSIVTNFTQPDPAMSAFLTCGVSYDSDLALVQRISLATLKEIQAYSPAADKNNEPIVLFNGFGDSNINMWLIMRAIDRGSTFALIHEMVTVIHKRFKEEGIEISYPVRKLAFSPRGDGMSDTLVATNLRNK